VEADAVEAVVVALVVGEEDAEPAGTDPHAASATHMTAPSPAPSRLRTGPSCAARSRKCDLPLQRHRNRRAREPSCWGEVAFGNVRRARDPS